MVPLASSTAWLQLDRLGELAKAELVDAGGMVVHMLWGVRVELVLGFVACTHTSPYTPHRAPHLGLCLCVYVVHQEFSKYESKRARQQAREAAGLGDDGEDEEDGA